MLCMVWPLTNHRNPLRTNQFYMKEMTTYAASLTGAKGKALEPETITIGAKRPVKLTEKAEKAPAKSKNALHITQMPEARKEPKKLPVDCPRHSR
jgi:hypothetical protein